MLVKPSADSYIDSFYKSLEQHVKALINELNILTGHLHLDVPAPPAQDLQHLQAKDCHLRLRKSSLQCCVPCVPWSNSRVFATYTTLRIFMPFGLAYVPLDNVIIYTQLLEPQFQVLMDEDEDIRSFEGVLPNILLKH